MKQFKKILCGLMLTSFVIIGSVNVFANGLGGNDGGGNGGTDCNLYEERVSYSVEEAKRYKEVANADMQLNAGHIWGDDAGEEIKYLL